MNIIEILLGIIALLLLAGIIDIVSRLRIIIDLLEEINCDLRKEE